jgi:hypothetical protein
MYSCVTSSTCLLIFDSKASRPGRNPYGNDFAIENEWYSTVPGVNPFTEPPDGLRYNSLGLNPAPNIYKYSYPHPFPLEEDVESEDENYINLSFLDKEKLEIALATNSLGPSLSNQSPAPSIGRNGSLKRVQQPSSVLNVIHSRYLERDSAGGEAVIELLTVPNLSSPSGKNIVPAFRWM